MVRKCRCDWRSPQARPLAASGPLSRTMRVCLWCAFPKLVGSSSICVAGDAQVSRICGVHPLHFKSSCSTWGQCRPPKIASCVVRPGMSCVSSLSCSSAGEKARDARCCSWLSQQIDAVTSASSVPVGLLAEWLAVDKTVRSP